MRDLIVQAFTRALKLLLPARGRHRDHRPEPGPGPVPPHPPSPWSRPWHGPSAETARAVFTADEAWSLPPEQREWFYARAWADLGWEYPVPPEANP
ncbi:hypothetical protein ABZ714_09630 [Streptomyces sp. NPDC006798]|uniref:hypothetical protein n=1 Tax=Streptomyces sp. NPDC006798 TaxID=3155462 RepID=UPI0033E2BCC1